MEYEEVTIKKTKKIIKKLGLKEISLEEVKKLPIETRVFSEDLRKDYWNEFSYFGEIEENGLRCSNGLLYNLYEKDLDKYVIFAI